MIVDKKNYQITIRWIVDEDLDHILKIESSSDFPWKEKDFLACCKNQKYIGLLVESDKEIVAFVVFQIQKSQFRINKLTVAEEYLRCGIGSIIIEKIKKKLSYHGRNKIFVMVRESNLKGQLFFKSQGFLATKVHRGYFKDTGEDGYCMYFNMSGVN